MTTSSTIILAAAAIAGGVCGSFLTACIRALPRREPIAWPAKTSSRFFIVEGLTAVLFAGALYYYGPSWLLVSRVLFGCALIVLFATDLEHRLLPNAITLPGIVIGFGFSLVSDPGWRSSLIGIALGGGLPYAVAAIYYRVRGREGLGMGDVKMLAMIGAFLGGPAVIITLMLASIAGSIVGLLVMVLGRGGLQFAMPFGTFLAASAALVATIGAPLLEWLRRQ